MNKRRGTLPNRLRERKGRWMPLGGEAAPLVRRRRAWRGDRRARTKWETFQNFRGSAHELEPYQLLCIRTTRAGGEVSIIWFSLGYRFVVSIFFVGLWQRR